MRKRVPAAVVALILTLVLIIVGFFTYKMVLAPSPTARGIGKNGKPMTDAEANGLVQRMSGGRAPKNLFSQGTR